MAAKNRRKKSEAIVPRAQAAIGSGRLPRLLKIVWWLICLGVIAWWAWSAEPIRHAASSEQDRETLFFGIMAALSFPAGLAWALVVPRAWSSLPLAEIDVTMLPWYAQAVAVWFGCAALGYAQWFWLVPHVLSMRADDV